MHQDVRGRQSALSAKKEEELPILSTSLNRERCTPVYQLLGPRYSQRFCAGRETAWLVGIATVLIFVILGGLKFYLPSRVGTGSPITLHGNHSQSQSPSAAPATTSTPSNSFQGKTAAPASTSTPSASLPATSAGTATAPAKAGATPVASTKPPAAAGGVAATAAATGFNPGFDGGRDPDPPAHVDVSEGSRPWRPAIIGHRGASAKMPEHTREAYIEAVTQGADFIECDVVLTKDFVPLCRHSPWLSNSTNADTVFPNRITTKTIDGQELKGVFASDLTMEEVKKLRARQPFSFRDASLNDKYELVTLDQFLAVAKTFRPVVGVYPEIKNPAWHNALPHMKEEGVSIEDVVLRTLRLQGYGGPRGSSRWMVQPVFLQSFDSDVLKKLSKKTCIPLVQLVQPGPPGSPNPVSGDKLVAIKQYADTIGVEKSLLVKWGSKGYESSGVMELAHKDRLLVHAWTLRDEKQFVLEHLEGDVSKELDLVLQVLKADGVFVDSPKTAASWLDKLSGKEWDMPVSKMQGNCRNAQH